MMEHLADALTKRSTAIFVVVSVLLLAGVAAWLAQGVEQDDDLLAFLPPDNPDVQLFYDINKRFGGLDVAIIGIEGDDIFSPEFLNSLDALTADLNGIPQVGFALSIANVQDFTLDEEMGGIKQAPLVYPLPKNELEADFMRDKVMSRDLIVGNLVSPTADAVNIYCFLAAETPPRDVAVEIRKRVDEALPDHQKYWGGNPFISTWIYETTQADLDKLVPYSIIVIVLILMLTFGDLRGTFLSLLSTGMGIAAANGLMAALGIRYNIVLSSMPIILFAVGSAYSIHLLARYYALEPKLGRDGAIRHAMITLGPTIFASGLTTVAGLLSFLTMDIEPMRTFGLFTAVGIFVTLVLSLTFVPAVIHLTGPRKRPSRFNGMRLMNGLVLFCRGRPIPVLAVLLIGCAVASFYVSRVETRMDTAAFFQPGSPPDQAERFLDRHFGGSQFIQVLVKGDMREPQVLREIQYIGDQLTALDDVTAAIHIADPVALANSAMEGIRRVPDSSAKIGLLLSLMTGDKSIEQLVNQKRTEAVIQLKVGATQQDELEIVLAQVETLLADYKPSEGPDRPSQMVSARLQSISRLYGVSLDYSAAEQQFANLPKEVSVAQLAGELKVFMNTEEFLAELPPDSPNLKAHLAAALAAVDPDDPDALLTAIATTLGLPEDDMLVSDVQFSIETPLTEIRTLAASKSAAAFLLENTATTLPEPPNDELYLAAVGSALVDLDLLGPQAGTAKQITMQVSGLPVLYRGLSASVNANQQRSLAVALLLVFLIMAVLFRSVTTGLLATVPTLLTLLAVYGAMGGLGVTLDIGTSMLAGLIIGAGVDYAVHMLAAWQAPDGKDLDAAAIHATENTAPAIWTAAFMVAAGFFVLTLGESKPLQNVGLLTAAAMLVAACATFVAIPALARKASYGRRTESPAPLETEISQ